MTPVWEIALHLAVAGDVYDGVFLCCPFSHERSCMTSWTLVSQTIFLVNVGLAGDLLYGKKLFIWLSMVMSLVVSFCAVFFSHEMSWMGSGT